KNEFQHVRTTAYTHTEADHRQFSNHNALGGELHAAGPAIHRAEVATTGISMAAVDQDDVRQVSNSGTALQPFSLDEPRTTTRVVTTTRVLTATQVTTATRGARRAVAGSKPPPIGSAAADWSRWPMGTTFRLLSTG